MEAERTFDMYSMPTGYAGTFDSADVAAWRPTTFSCPPCRQAMLVRSTVPTLHGDTDFRMSSMPTGYAGTFDSADVNCRPTYFYMYSMPVGTYTIVITANGFAAWSTGLSNFRMQGNSLTQAQVDAILWDLYQAAKVPAHGDRRHDKCRRHERSTIRHVQAASAVR